MRFVLTTPADEVSLKYKGPVGEITLQEAVYRPFIEILAGNGSIPKLVADIESHPSSKGKSIGSIIEAMAVLTALGHAGPAQSDETIQAAAPACRRLNDFLCNRARDNRLIPFLASPVLGGGVVSDRLEQLFLLARQSGEKAPESWASFTWDILDSQRYKVLKDGKPLETREENRAELTRLAKLFDAQRLPVFKALGIV
jgi:hypothetical protein